MKFSNKRVKVKTNFQDKDAANLETAGRGIVTALIANVADFPNPTVKTATLTTQLDDLKSAIELIAGGDTREANTQLLAQKAGVVMASLAANGHYVEDIANLLAAGDTAHAKQLILNTTYELAVERQPHPRDFEVVESGPGWLHFRVKKAHKEKEAHLWRYGITTAKETKPVALILVVDDKVDIIITGLPTGSIIGMQHSGSELSGKVKRNGHPCYDYNNPDPYEWTDFLYVSVP
jgi:hypothetical protein